MKYTNQSFSVELIGTRYGYQWNDRLGWAHVSETVPDDKSLRQVVSRVCSPDFQDGKLTPDTVVKITLVKPNRRVTRYFEIGMFPSVHKYIGSMETSELAEA
jgi:hypothetical protein